MDFIFNSYSLVLLIFGMLTAIFSVYCYQEDATLMHTLAIMMGSIAIWCTAYSLELASTTLPQATIFINLQYFGIATLPINWFVFCLKFCNKGAWLKNRTNLYLLFSVPVITIIMVWTNPLHHLHYTAIKLLNTRFPVAKVYPGIWYYFFTSYFYLLMARGCYFMYQKFKKSGPSFRRQNFAVMIAALSPWIANLTYLLNIRPLGFIDVTPFAFILTCFLILLSIYRFRLFDIIPIAREKVLELMNDGFIVFNNKNNVIDYNKAIFKYVAIADDRIVDAPVERIFGSNTTLLDAVKGETSTKIESTATVNNEEVIFEADILRHSEGDPDSQITIVKLQDLTNAKKEAFKSKQQTLELEKLNQQKDRIFSIIAHDLRGPLINLSQILNMISQDQINIDEIKRLSPILGNDIVYTTDLLENLLHWSRSQLKGYGINKEHFNIRNSILNEITHHLPSATLKNVKIVHDVFPNEIGYMDALMFQIVIRNLLSNAIKFCKKDCEINITATYLRSGFVDLRIKDNGVGINEEQLSRLFTTQSTSGRGTNGEKGTGLGLMICKEFMERNGGEIIASSKINEGSTFRLLIPVKE